MSQVGRKMKKEILLSILIGFALGLVITFGIYTAKKTSQTIFQKPEVSFLDETADQSFNINQSVSIISPIDQSIIKEGKTVVSGVAAPNSTIVIIGEKGERIVTADDKGGFESEIFLESGENQIEIHSFPQDGNESNKIITVVYSTAEI